MTTQISTGGGAGHLTGCTCPFCTSNATTAEVTDIDLVETHKDAEDLSRALVLNVELDQASWSGNDAVSREQLAREVHRDYPEATRFVVEAYDDANDGPNAFLHIYNGNGVQIDGVIASFRPSGLEDDEPWHVDVAEAMRPGATAVVVKESHRQMLAKIAEAYPEWNIAVPPDLSKNRGMGKGARAISEQQLRARLAPERMMMQRAFNGTEWTGPLTSNVVRINRVTDRQVVVDYMDGTGRQSTTGGPMRPAIGSSAVDDNGRVYLLNAENQPFIAYDPMD